MYCGRPADSREHIIATQIIDVLARDPRELPLPIRLYITLPDGQPKTIHGRTSGGRPTLEYTTKVCERCNNEWMNRIDENAMPFLTPMIEGRPVVLDADAQATIAVWAMKVVVTARSEPNNPLHIDASWTDWLYNNQSPIPNWYVWIGKYIGTAPWWYNPQDVRVQLGPGSAPPAPWIDFIQDHGVLATLVIGYVVVQVFGVGGSGVLLGPTEAAFPQIWPNAGATLTWPPAEHIDDSGLPLWANRLMPPPQ
jgi:hypothetical protein